jgi:hypothetical protein
MVEIAAATSATRAAYHAAAASPTFGDSATTELSQHTRGLARSGAIPMQNGKSTRTVEFLLFNYSPDTVSNFHRYSMSGAV